MYLPRLILGPSRNAYKRQEYYYNEELSVYYYYDYCYFYSAYEASLTIFYKVDQKHHD